MKPKYLVYGHYNDGGSCFYVGIGSEGRSRKFSSRTAYWKNYVKKHCVSGKPEVKIWHRNLTEEQAKEHEIFWISVYGRRDLGTGCLVNLTDGGEGIPNPSLETRRRISEAHKGRVRGPQSEEHRRKIGLKSKGRKHREEAIQKNRQAHLGKKIGPCSEERKRKIGEANSGRKHTEEAIQKMREIKKGKKASEETKRKMSEIRKGRPSPTKGKQHSEETRQRMSETRTNRGKGYSFNKNRKKWVAYITINNKRKTLGFFETEEEAGTTYRQALNELLNIS
jgi:hypothetical protein